MGPDAISLDVPQLLERASRGDEPAAARLLPLVYDSLRQLAGRQLRRRSVPPALESAGLVHEAYLKLVGQTQVDWKGKTHFFAVAATTLRRILVDHARKEMALKRGGGQRTVLLDEASALSPQRSLNVLALDESLEELAKLDPRAAQVIELRFFGGMSEKEAAEHLGVAERTVRDDWATARAWLRCKLSSGTRS